MASHRPRRTRIYGANYDIGESYYKKQLEDLDKKRGIHRATTPTFVTPTISDDLKFRDSIFKSGFGEEKSFAFPKRALSYEPSSDFFDDEFGSSALSKKISSVKFGQSDDADFGSLRARSVRKAFDALDAENGDSFGILKPARKRLDAFDADEANDSSYISRKLKIKTGVVREEQGEEAEQASMRMKASKSRLADLESEMLDLNMRHSEREKRNQNLKRLLNDCDAMNDVDF